MTSRRRKIAGGIAVLALASGFAVAGTMAASAAPLDVTFTSGDMNVTAANPTISGTVTWDPVSTAGGAVTLDIVQADGTTLDDVACDTLGAAESTWSCPVSLAYGANTIRAVATAADDPGSPQSTANTIQVTVGSTEPVTITSPAPGDSTATTTPTFSGTGPRMGSVTVQARLAGATTAPFDDVCTTTVDRFGAWSCATNFPGPETYTVRATGLTNTAIGVGGAAEQTLTITPGGTLTITTPADGSSQPYGSDPVVIAGTSPLAATVDVVVDLDGTPFESCDDLDVDGAGQWSCTLPAGPTPPPGHYSITATQAGSPTATAAFIRRQGAPDLIGPYEFEQGESSATFGGQILSPGSTRFDIVGQGLGCADADVVAGEYWECTVDLSALPLGVYTLHAQHYTVDDADLDSDVSSTTLEIVPVDVGPSVDCVFSPAGAAISSAEDLNIQVYTTTPTSGGSGSLGNQGYCSGDVGVPLNSAGGWTYSDDFILCDDGCTLTGLAPGYYDIYYSEVGGSSGSGSGGSGGGGTGSSWRDYHFRVPVTPVITATESTASRVTLRGTAAAGDTVRIERLNGAALCTTTATAAGTWACRFATSSANSARAIAIDPPSGGMSALSTPRGIPVLTAPPPADDPLPTLVSWFLNFDGDFMNLRPGDAFTITVSGMPEGTEIEVWMHSTPRLLGTATGTGAPMSMDLVVPMDIENGTHEIEMIAVTPLGTHYFFTNDAMVSGGVDPAPLDDPATPGDESAGEGSEGAGGDRQDPGTPSALSASIATVERVAENPVAIAIAGGLALALLFLVALPTELLNSSLSSNTNRLGRAYGVVDRAFTRAQDWFIRVTRSPALAAGILVTLVALIYGFVDPHFGVDIVSLRLVLSLGLAFFILSYGASWLSGLVTKRLWGVQNTIVLQPSIILFAILGVVVARVLDFSPGFLVGVAIGLELVAASKRVAARAVVVQFGFVVGLALAAWVAYSLFTPGNDFVGMLTEDMLVAVTAEGLTGALIAIFPLRFLDGREIWEDSKPLWAACFVVVATAFALLVLPTAIEGTDVSDFVVWVAVFAVFGALSVGAWLLFSRAARREEIAEHEKVDAA